jgi:hypothetical protein
LNVGLLVENTELIVTVDKLDTHVVSGLTGMLILIDQVIHLILKGVDDQVQLVSMVDQLADGGQLLSEFKVSSVQLGSVLVTKTHLSILPLSNVCELSLLLLTFVLQNVELVLEDLDTLSHFSQIL